MTSMMPCSSVSFGSIPDKNADTHEPLDRIRELVRGEYLEMPGLCLTLPQAMRLWSLDREVCAAALEGLVSEGFLQPSPDRMYRVTGAT